MDASRGQGRRSSALRRGACLLCLSIVGPAAIGAPEGRPQFVGPVTPALRAAVERAWTEATTRLDRETCAGMFGELRDAEGRALSANLRDLPLSAQAFLQAIRFADGEHQVACGNDEVFAFTHPGAAVVYLCGMRFALLARPNPNLGAALLLHEELQALGLGENPPASREVTMRVRTACGATVRPPLEPDRLR